ncbi:MAG TPA: S-layer homology domain-containing protein, partial [Thermoanaerobaculia bacterium]
EFQVNSYTTGNQAYSSVAADPAGGFVVVWESGGQDGDSGGIFGQRYDGSGAPLGSEFAANAYTTGNQSDEFVATDAGGNFIAVWNSLSRDGSGSGVFAQRFDNTGQPAGSDFQVNTYTTGYQIPNGVAMDAAGDFVVVWGGYGPLGTSGVFARLFDKGGTPRGDPIQVNSGSGFSPSVAMDRAGEFVVAWEGSDGAGSGIVARRFDATGTPAGAQFPVNAYTTSDQASPSVAMDGSGNFVVAWQSYGQDGDDYGIFARRFDRFGAAASSEFAVSAYTTGYQGVPRAATSDIGSFVVSWQDGARDGDGFGVFARRAALSAAAAIAVDTRSGAGLTTNANGLLEPGETAAVEPAWTNSGGAGATFTGAATSLTGPPGATYTLADGDADYGTLAAGASKSCHDATGDCYAVTVSDPAVRPATHWDVALQESLSLGTPKTWVLHVGRSFADVPVSQPFYKRIETLLHSGITAGCTPTAYCPGAVVSRSEMAIFIAKGIAGGGTAIPASGTVGADAYSCKPGGVSLFTDVPPTDVACKHVHFIAAQNVTLGCSADLYCPGDDVTRVQMAAFIAKAIVAPGGAAAIPKTYGPDPVTGFSYSCDTGSPAIHFSDVPASDPFCKHIHYLWAKGVVDGCTATTYCPNDNVTRDAMAKFLVNGFRLQLYGP